MRALAWSLAAAVPLGACGAAEGAVEVALTGSSPATSRRQRPASTCGARVWAKDEVGASEYVARQHKLRAPYYLRSARKSFEAGLRQLLGKDKSNSDPYIKQHEGLLQVAAALDLDPDEPELWLDAGKVSVALGSLTEESSVAQHALSFFARACRLSPPLLAGLSEWLTNTSKGIPKVERDARAAMWREVQDWNTSSSVPELPVTAFPSITDGTCAARSRGGAALPSVAAREKDEEVSKVLNNFQMRNIFPTRLLHTNVREHLPDGFAQRLSDLCIQKYREFSRRFPGMDPNDLNDKFFGYQITSEEELRMAGPEVLKRWPEMYVQSDDFKQLLRLMRGALWNFVTGTGLQPLPEDDQAYRVVLWAAVYPGNGGRHGYHVHQNSISSCVLYLRTAGATTPISFLDPRGAPPVNDYEQHLGERDFEPVAPFHHNEYFFPESGDLVCFPSWLVHSVPSHWESETRVAFAANLQGSAAWDSWHRTAAGWT